MGVTLPSPPPFPWPSERLRAAQKDEHVIAVLKREANQLVQTLAGPRRGPPYKPAVEAVVEALYYGLTTLSDRQTLGEEYARLVLTDASGRRLPSKHRRTAAFVLQILLPAVWQAFARRRRSSLASAVALWTGLLRLRLAAFYLFADRLRWSERLTDLRHVAFGRPATAEAPDRLVFRVLGSLLAVRLAVDGATFVGRRFSDRTTTSPEGGEGETTPDRHDCGGGVRSAAVETRDWRRICALCSDSEVSGSWTCTPCAHVFCWDCIAVWLQNEARCPVCRQETTPNRLVSLRNYG